MTGPERAARGPSISGGEPPAGRYDAIVVGSGFGGSVLALRLAEKGYRVAVLEQGGRIEAAQIAAAARDPRQLLWAPRLRMFGYLSQHLFRDVAILGGVGVGGGSLVYAAVLLEPESALFDRPEWRRAGIDAGALAPHYRTAARMLGRATTPRQGTMDEYLAGAAAALGAADRFGPTPTGIYFGPPGERRPDPYFGGRGPARTGCRFCGECLAGCRYGAKNSLDRNYLYLAEQLGARCLPGHRVERIEPVAEGYRVVSTDPRGGAARPALVAGQVFLAAGVVGTVELLLRCREQYRSLPHLSPRLGRAVRTNSEAIVGVEHPNPPAELTDGVAVSSHLFLGADTHITQNRIPAAQGLLRLAATPMIDDDRPLRRSARTLAATLRAPGPALRAWARRDWWRRVTVLTVMQHVDSELELVLARGLRRPRLQTRAGRGRRPPTYLPVANEAARALAAHAGGRPFSLLPESVANRSITAHILGGCPLGPSAEEGVVDGAHRVFGYPGLYVVDGSVMPANIGVNPSLTITAMAERCASLVPARAAAGTAALAKEIAS